MPRNEDTLKVITYNIRDGFDLGKNTFRKENVANWIKSKNPDVVALQELCAFNQKMLEEFAKEWGHNYVLILKENEGYPVGITSNKPIVLKKKIRKGLWHGMLHAQTHGVDFFVVHLSPSEQAFRKKEADIITKNIKKLSRKSNYIVLGDFNSNSPFDREFDKKHPYLLKSKKNEDLLVSEVDYSVMSTFLALPLIDVCERFVPLDNRRTYPTYIDLSEKEITKEDSIEIQRIDFILTSSHLASRCIGATIYNGDDTHYLSDHYPIEAIFKF